MPAPGFWAFLVLIVAIIQLPPILILGPIAAYVFANNDSTVVAVVFLIWSLVVSGSDGFLKPIFLGRGVAVPMLVVLVGAIGGMIAAGVIGLFLGAVILVCALGYLGVVWLKPDMALPKVAGFGAAGMRSAKGSAAANGSAPPAVGWAPLNATTSRKSPNVIWSPSLSTRG